MIILFFITSTLASRVYPISQIQATQNFQLEYESGSLTVDLNSEMSYLSKAGDKIRCNSAPFGEQIQCQHCSPDCIVQDSQLISSEITLVDIFNEEETEPIIYTSTNESEILGLGLQRGARYPQNPFVSKVFHICFGYTRGFVSREFKNPNLSELQYKANESNYQVDLRMIKVNDEMVVDTYGNITYVDSKEPFILLPEEEYIMMRDYLQEYGVEEEGKYLIVKDKSRGLPTIELIFEKDEKIRLEKDAYSYRLIDGREIVTFYRSKINRIKLGLPFLTQQLITIDQNNQKLFISKYNCQDQFKQSQQNTPYLKHIVIPFVLMCLTFYCLLSQRAKNGVKRRQLEQQELVKLKEEEEQI
ncbi:unnamed protein product (macronuclear) [Paramecium tetraurelia]|uniref:Peptidase A1 domain-containing protein n=1 Tax=Paramecium tetraurelia TaxID=5888 RepID=A0EAC8_PARTE|nr:uncharacterized protein GSPATT00024977001 [Paramecium tetraurelia]CAK92245.1 unnamed protein product [Paramecium tetraurelia]|eukprot:XP_001459642.1 hypothetical protein (macronuclear) [Paramecium tetraurelia strain d4-2]